MFNKAMKPFAAVVLSASLLFGMGAFAEETEKSDKGSVSLSIADNREDQTEEGTEVQTEKATEAKVVYDQLETTNVSDAVINAVDVSEIVASSMPSVVAITGKSVQEVESYYYGKQSFETEGAGSGFIIAQNDDELLIATNNHVVEGTTELTVEFTVEADDADELLAPAVVKGTNSANDLAVIAVKLADINADVLKQLKIATLGSSDNLKVGEAAVVIGNALGTGQTVTTGIISALGREVVTEAGTFTEIQVDAAVNLGCSGGAILNSKGEVIAITDAKATGDYAESMGYGIPIDTAIPILKDLINRQTRTQVENHGYLGVSVVPISDEAQQMYGMPAGAYVYSVTEGSAAEKAGIKKGDIITGFDGVSVASSDELVKLIGYYEAGETVKVDISTTSDGEYASKEVEVTLISGDEAGVAQTDDADDTSKADDSQNSQQDDEAAPSQNDDNQNEGNSQRQMPGNGGWEEFFGNMFGDRENGTW